MPTVYQVWPKPSCKARWKGEEDETGRKSGEKKTPGNGQAWNSPSPRGQWRTQKNGENWLWSPMWCPNGEGIIIIIINPLTARVLGAPQMILQPVFSIFILFSTALWDLPNSRPVHSLMLSSHLFLCLPCRLFTIIRRSSCGPLLRSGNLLLWWLNRIIAETCSITISISNKMALSQYLYWVDVCF